LFGRADDPQVLLLLLFRRGAGHSAWRLAEQAGWSPLESVKSRPAGRANDFCRFTLGRPASFVCVAVVGRYPEAARSSLGSRSSGLN
jgi:hypothetical protein